MVNKKNITFTSILKSNKKRKKKINKNVETNIIKKKKVIKQDILKITKEINNIKLDDEKISILELQQSIEKKLKISYQDKMIIIPIFLDNNNCKFNNNLKYFKYGLYTLYIVLQKNRKTEIFEKVDINHETINKYYPILKKNDIVDIIHGIIDNGLHIYTIILNNLIPDIKLQFNNIDDKYEWSQFNSMIDIKSIQEDETIIEHLCRMHNLNYKNNILSINIKIDKENYIKIYDIIKIIKNKKI